MNLLDHFEDKADTSRVQDAMQEFKISEAELKETLHGLEKGGVTKMKASLSNDAAQLQVLYQADMRYKGQAMTLTIGMESYELESSENLLKDLRDRFNKAHHQQFGFSNVNAEIETMRLRAKVVDASEEVTLKPLEQADTSEPWDGAVMAKQSITCDGKQVEATFWDRALLGGAGKKVFGPAVISEMDSNTLILPGYFGEIDSMGNILIWPVEKKASEKVVHTKESAQQLVKEYPIITTLIASALGSIRREMDTLVGNLDEEACMLDKQSLLIVL